VVSRALFSVVYGSFGSVEARWYHLPSSQWSMVLLVVLRQGGIIMAGSGLEIGRNVLILYNDPTPHSVRSLGYSSKNNIDSDWIIPGYFYPLRQFRYYF